MKNGITLAIVASLVAACAGAAAPPSQSPSPSPAPTASPAPSPTDPPPVRFEIVGDEPVIRRGPAGGWDGEAILPGALLAHDDGYTLFFRGFGPDEQTGLGVYESSDLKRWTRSTDEPFEIDLGVRLERPGATPWSGVILDDGTWALYTAARTLLPPQRTGVWRLTGPGPDGLWEASPDMLVAPGPLGAWDMRAVDIPSIHRVDGTWVMFYDGNASGQTDSVGMATSDDGVTWEKVEDPVLEPGTCGEADARSVQLPRVVPDGDGWLMTYHGFSHTGNFGTILAADSVDGITWRCRSPEPVIDLLDIPIAAEFLHTNLLFRMRDGDLRMLVEVGADDGTDVWLAVPAT